MLSSGVGVDDFTVDLAGLAGFKLDLQDLGTTFSSNAAKLLPGVALPKGSAGLLSTLSPSLEKFQTAVSAAQKLDLTAIGTLADGLSAAAGKYQATDGSNANALSAVSASAFGAGAGSAQQGGSEGVNRFSGLQLPTLADVEEAQYTVRQVVSAGIEAISMFDEPLSRAIGMRPAADYLSPLEADWEALQAIGKRIGLIEINDFVASQNLTGGSQWLQRLWSGEAARAFGESSGRLVQSVAGRSSDLEAVAKIVENGGALLERLVYNQAVGLADAITQPMSFMNFTLPLGSLAQLIDRPMLDARKAEIVAAVDAMKAAATSRQDSISSAITTLSRALDYSPGRTVPALTSSEFEIPAKVVADLGARRYGFGDNVWWVSQIEATT
ncbi:hypothetical protein AB0H76_06940 [Nocardia sp. NPDC050712]|uniref:hypothetical protein n=1 Tax=Nocardia sp. NPDC050712 TaxID=3155518 RepID=UPI0033C81E9C